MAVFSEIIEKPRLKVIIVGAGLGGMTAAIAIKQAGHDVVILEQASHLREVGAGIQLPPNASKILIRMGMKEKFEAKCIQPASFILRSYKDGKILSTQPLVPYAENVYGYPYWHIHRADFHALMVEESLANNIEIRLNSRVEKIDFSKPSVTLTSGRITYGDLIIAADGLKSVCRELLLDRPDPPRLTGDLAYRILLPRSEIKRYPELGFLSETPQINYWMGPDSHIVLYMLQGGEMFNAVILCPDDMPPGVTIVDADVKELQEKYKNWDPTIRKLLSLVKTAQKWRLQNSKEMEHWSHPEGKFVLLGDACHSMLPYLAQGAAQAIEDGAVLGGLLGKLEKREQLIDVLKLYENLRKKRTTRIVEGSTALQEVFHVHDGPQQEERDRQMRLQPFIGYPNMWADPEFQPYLFGYDVAKEVERGWQWYKSGKGTEVPPYTSKLAVLRSNINGITCESACILMQVDDIDDHKFGRSSLN